MSVFKKERGDRSYVYFQLYGGRRRKVQYLGPGNQLATWEKAERLILEYLDKRLADFYAQVPDELMNRIQPKEGIRRLLKTPTPEAQSLEPGISMEILTRSEAMSNQFGELLEGAIPLRIFDPDEVKTLKRAKKILEKSGARERRTNAV
jgi:hypothetical protein